MDVNEDVNLIVYLQAKFNLSTTGLSSCHFKWREMFILMFSYTPNSIYHLQVCQAATSNGEMDVNQDVHLIVYIPNSIYGLSVKLPLQMARDVHLIVYLHTKFNLSSVCQAVTSNGDMDFNQDVHLICLLTPQNSIYHLFVKLPLQMARWMSMKMFI